MTTPAGRMVLLASPRPPCAKVERAVETVQRALRTAAGPVYVRKQIVHNTHVVTGLQASDAIFVNELEEIPRPAARGSGGGWSPRMACRPRRGRDMIDFWHGRSPSTMCAMKPL